VNPLVIQIFHIPTFIQPNSERHTHMMNMNINQQFDRFYNTQRLVNNQETLTNGNKYFGNSFDVTNRSTGDNIVRKLTNPIGNAWNSMWGNSTTEADLTKDFQNQSSMFEEATNALNDGDLRNNFKARKNLETIGIDTTGASDEKLAEVASKYNAMLQTLNDEPLKRKEASSQFIEAQNELSGLYSETMRRETEAFEGGFRDIGAEAEKDYYNKTGFGTSAEESINARLQKAGVTGDILSHILEKSGKKATDEKKHETAVTVLQDEINKALVKIARDQKIDRKEALRQAYEAPAGSNNPLRQLLEAQANLTDSEALNPALIQSKRLNDSAGLLGVDGYGSTRRLEANEATRIAGGDVRGGKVDEKSGYTLERGTKILHDFDNDENGVIEQASDGSLYHVVSTFNDETKLYETSKHKLPWQADEFTEKVKPSLSATEVFKQRSTEGTTFIQKREGDDKQTRGDLFAVKTTGSKDDADKEKKALEIARTQARKSKMVKADEKTLSAIKKGEQYYARVGVTGTGNAADTSNIAKGTTSTEAQQRNQTRTIAKQAETTES
jgi:hypothetical protein